MKNSILTLAVSAMIALTACSNEPVPQEQACECPPTSTELAATPVATGDVITIEARECFDCPPVQCDNCMDAACEDCPPATDAVSASTHACGANCHCLKSEAIAMIDRGGQPCNCMNTTFTRTYAHLLT